MNDEDEGLKEGEEYTFTKGKYKIETESCILYVDLNGNGYENCRYLTLKRIDDDEFYKHI